MKTAISKTVNQALKEKTLIRLNRAQLERLKSLSQVILALVAAGGIITLAAVAPNALQVIGFAKKVRTKFKSLAYDEKQKKLQDSFYYLKNSGLIKFRKEKGDFYLSLSQKGIKLLEKLNFRTISIKKPKVWDKKWWVIAADIPTKEHRLGADQLRSKLKEMGFYFLQRTLWFYPYDPRAEIEFIATTYGVERFLTVMEINRIDLSDEQKLKQFFNL